MIKKFNFYKLDVPVVVSKLRKKLLEKNQSFSMQTHSFCHLHFNCDFIVSGFVQFPHEVQPILERLSARNCLAIVDEKIKCRFFSIPHTTCLSISERDEDANGNYP